MKQRKLLCYAILPKNLQKENWTAKNFVSKMRWSFCYRWNKNKNDMKFEKKKMCFNHQIDINKFFTLCRMVKGRKVVKKILLTAHSMCSKWIVNEVVDEMFHMQQLFYHHHKNVFQIVTFKKHFSWMSVGAFKLIHSLIRSLSFFRFSGSQQILFCQQEIYVEFHGLWIMPSTGSWWT